MTINKPESYPDWCLKDNSNGKNNTPTKIPYPQDKIDDGWNNGEIPRREWENYHKNLNSLWIRYFDNQIVSINETLDSINTTLKSFSTHFSSIDTTLSSFSNQISSIDTTINSQNTRIEYCEEKIKEILEQTTILMGKIS